MLFTWRYDPMCLLNMIARQKRFENDKNFYRFVIILYIETAIFMKMAITQIFICAKYFSLSWSIWQNNSLTAHKQHYTKGVKTALKNLLPLWNNGKKNVKLNLVKLM